MGGADPKLSTLHPSLPQLLSMPSCPASPLGGLSESSRSYSGFSWQPAGGRREQLRGVGVERCRGRVGGVSTHRGARAGENLLSPIQSHHPLPSPEQAAPARPLPTRSGFAEILCRTNAGRALLRAELRVGGGGAERQMFPLP